MSFKLIFEIELHSDYHISAGYGLGPLVDSALHRDTNGIPVLRGTTLTGLLRDSLYRLLQLKPLHGYRGCQGSGAPGQAPRFCGQNDPEQQDCPVCRIFGSPRTIKHWHIGSAHPPVAGQWQAGVEGAQITPHVCVNPRTRRADAHKLFFREEGDARLRFEFAVSCDVNTPEMLWEAAWLVAAARNVRSLGANRRRGRGRCSIHLKAVETDLQVEGLPLTGEAWQEFLLNKFEAYQLACRALVVDTELDRDFKRRGGHSGASGHRLEVLVYLNEPVIVSGKAEAGNEFASLDYIPGTVIRGALAGRAASQYRLDDPRHPAYEVFVRLFFRDGVCFSPLYPVYEDGAIYSSIPAPLDLLSCELNWGFALSDFSTAHGAESFAHRLEQEDLMPTCKVCPHDQGGSGLVPWSGFLSLRHPPDRVEPKWVTEMHVHIDPATQRAASGDLFSYKALAAGQYLAGEIICTNNTAWEDLRVLCNLDDALGDEGTRLRLGRANRRGYGWVTLWIGEPTEKMMWCPLSLEKRVADPAIPLVMTFLTDAIIVDRWGRALTALDGQDIAGLLGLDTLPGVNVEAKRGFFARRIIDTFNSHLGLPRWRDVAIRAGSAIGLVIRGVTNENRQQVLDRLKKAELEGIGLRRGEGFGRIVFQHPIYQACTALGEQGILSLKGRRREAETESPLKVEERFRRHWEAYLAEDARLAEAGKRDPFAAKEFGALARLLRTLMPASPNEVEGLIKRLGQSKELLPPQMLAKDSPDSLYVREEEKAELNFFRGNKAKEGLTALRQRIAKLESEIDMHIRLLPEDDRKDTQARCWRIGIELLADRVAAVAGKESNT